jgi:hypothetical protein
MEDIKEPKAEMPNRPEKMSYEQLENVARQLSEQNRHLHIQLQAVNQENMFARLSYLFEVVRYKDSFNTDFVTRCVSEIEGIMTPPERETKEE